MSGFIYWSYWVHIWRNGSDGHARVFVMVVLHTIFCSGWNRRLYWAPKAETGSSGVSPVSSRGWGQPAVLRLQVVVTMDLDFRWNCQVYVLCDSVFNEVWSHELIVFWETKSNGFIYYLKTWKINFTNVGFESLKCTLLAVVF